MVRVPHKNLVKSSIYGQGPSEPRSWRGSYRSNILPQFFEKLRSGADAQIADFGFICGNNIQVFSTRVKALSVFDLFALLSRNRAQSLGFRAFLKELDYAQRSFDGILLWQLPDCIAEEQLAEFKRRCYQMLKPGGLAMTMSQSKDVAEHCLLAFCVTETHEVHFRPRNDVRFALRARENRQMVAAMAPFREVGAFIYRNGLKESLFQR